MRLCIVAALSGLAAAALVMSGPSADAAPKKRILSQSDVSLSSQTRARRAQQRPRTRITVRPRTYLDGGTEVLPGERKFTGYAYSPNHSASSVLGGTGVDHRSALPGPFDLPGRNNPMQSW